MIRHHPSYHLRLGAGAAGTLLSAALCDRAGRQPSVDHDRRAEGHQLEHARRAARAVQCRRARVLLLDLGRPDRQELARRAWRRVPGLATEWRRIDDQTVELKLRQGVKFHNGDEMTAEDVVFTLQPRAHVRRIPKPRTAAPSRRSRRSRRRAPARNCRRKCRRPRAASWPDLVRVEAVDKYTVRFYNATPDVTLEGRLSRYGSDIMSRRGWEEAASYLDWARKPITTGPYKVVEFKPDVSLTLEAHDEYWGGRPPLKRIRFVEVPEVRAASTACCRASTSSPATSRRTRSPASRRTRPSRCRAAPS